MSDLKPEAYFRDEHAEFTNKYGTKSIWHYRCNLCGVRVLHKKSMGRHIRRLHTGEQFGHNRRVLV